MMFHFGFELPQPRTPFLDHTSPDLTSEEVRILKCQIRQNSDLINKHVYRLDLLVNKEQYPHKEIFIEKLRRRLELLMEENDTFRKVLWRHFQKDELLKLDNPNLNFL